jgi:hypothetical protein
MITSSRPRLSVGCVHPGITHHEQYAYETGLSEKDSNMPFESRQITNIYIVCDNRQFPVPFSIVTVLHHRTPIQHLLGKKLTYKLNFRIFHLSESNVLSNRRMATMFNSIAYCGVTTFTMEEQLCAFAKQKHGLY